MRTILAIIIAICTGIWVYGSLRFYNNCIRNQSCDYSISNPSLEILIMLLWAFIFGYLFGNILSGLKKRKYIKKSQLESLKWSYTQSKKYWLYENKEVDSHNSQNEKNIFNKTSSIKNKLNQDVDTNFWMENLDLDSSEYINNTSTNQNTDVYNASKLSKKNNVDIKKKSFFWSFLDDLNLSNKADNTKTNTKVDTQNIIEETKIEANIDTQDIAKTAEIEARLNPQISTETKKNTQTSTKKTKVKSEIKNLSAKKTTKYSSKDTSIKKVHEKNLNFEKSKKDDLTKIEWIGPKISELLHNNNIHTFIDLARTDTFKLSEILVKAGSRYQMHNPKTWPQQSVFAAKGEWDNLKAYQKKLNGWRA